MTPEEDASIAVLWPAEWARANDRSKPGSGKRRQKLRQRYRHKLELDAMMLANPEARCSSCEHSDRNPTPGLRGLFCQLDSDFHGYAGVAPDYVCARWSPTVSAALAVVETPELEAACG